MVRVYWKPTCQTCRRVVKQLRRHVSELELINLTETPPSQDILERLSHRYGVRNLLRKRSKYYDAKRFGEMGDGEILGMMLEKPDLIRRPIVVVGENVILGDDREGLRNIIESSRPKGGR